MHSTPPPKLGSIVTYRSRTGLYDVPAIVTATQATIYVDNIEKGLIAPLSSVRHVHLTVFSPGPTGKRAEATDFKVESPHGRGENEGGSYPEWDIPEYTGEDEPEPGTWRWGAPAAQD